MPLRGLCCFSSSKKTAKKSDDINMDPGKRNNRKHKRQKQRACPYAHKKEEDSGGFVKNKLSATYSSTFNKISRFGKDQKTTPDDHKSFQGPPLGENLHAVSGHGSIQNEKKISKEQEINPHPRKEVTMETDSEHVCKGVADLTLEPSPPKIPMPQESIYYHQETVVGGTDHVKIVNKDEKNAIRRTTAGNNETMRQQETWADETLRGPEVICLQDITQFAQVEPKVTVQRGVTESIPMSSKVSYLEVEPVKPTVGKNSRKNDTDLVKEKEFARLYKGMNELKNDNLKLNSEVRRMRKLEYKQLNMTAQATTPPSNEDFNNLHKKYNRLKMENSQILESMGNLQQENADLQKRLVDVTIPTYGPLKYVNKPWDFPEHDYIDRVSKLEEELRKAQNQRDSLKTEKIRNKRMSQTNLTMEIDKLARDKNELMHILQAKDAKLNEVSMRLSEMASESMNKNNPCIEDLSTQNRSMKIGERYRADLYGNAWCDALEALYDTGLREDQSLQIICQTLMMGDPRTGTRDNQELQHKMKDCLRLRACDTSLQHLAKQYCEQHHEMDGTTGNSLAALQGFITMAIELCWMMVTQDPPVFLYDEVTAGSPIDETKFKPYRKKGGIVSYLVWPALLVQEDGPVLEKGVVSIG